MRITNINRHRSVDLTLKDPKGGPKVVSIRAGKSASVDISADDPQVVALLKAGQIMVGPEPKAPAPASSKPAAS